MRPNPIKLAGALLLCVAFPAHALDSASLELGRGVNTDMRRVGEGWRFAGHGEYDLGYRLQYLSNAGTSQLNDGINFNQIRFSYHFDAILN